MEPGWVGRRVSIRRAVEQEPDGASGAGRQRFADVVGDLVGLDAQTAVMDTRDGLVEVPVAAVALARLAPPSTAAELALEAVAARGMRAGDTEQLGGWLLRADHGFLRRANSVLPQRQLGMPLDEALERARDWYAARELPLRLAIPVEARRLLDAELGERGWPFEASAHVMVARLDQLDRGAEPSADVILADVPDDAWLARYRGGEGVSAAGRALLTRHDQVAFLSLRDGADTVAVGRGVVDEGWLGVSGVEVAPELRRRGLAHTVMRRLWRWGAEHGAHRTYLQVEADNTAALTLYDRLGYWVHHDYHYRREPEAGQ